MPEIKKRKTNTGLQRNGAEDGIRTSEGLWEKEVEVYNLGWDERKGGRGKESRRWRWSGRRDSNLGGAVGKGGRGL
jgi:hypothetical protein